MRIEEVDCANVWSSVLKLTFCNGHKNFTIKWYTVSTYD